MPSTNPTRTHLDNLSRSLLRLHKALLDTERILRTGAWANPVQRGLSSVGIGRRMVRLVTSAVSIDGQIR